MSTQSTFLHAAAFMTIASCVGCESAHRGTQLVGIAVTYTDTAKPVPRARVVCGPEGKARFVDLTKAKWEDYLDIMSAGEGRTDEAGFATLTVNTHMIASELYDTITIRTYLFGVSDDDGNHELLPVFMLPRMCSTGIKFRIRVLSIGDPIARQPPRGEGRQPGWSLSN